MRVNYRRWKIQSG